MICCDCIEELCQKVNPTKNLHKYHTHSQPFLRHLVQYQNEYKQIPNFIGHCCLINQFYGEESYGRDKCKVSGNKHSRKDDTHLGLQRTAELSPTLKSIRLGGCFVLPEFGLLLPTTTSEMDVFGLGDDREGLKPRWHFVLDEEIAVNLMMEGARPKEDVPDSWKVIETTLLVASPHCLAQKKKKVSANIYITLFTGLTRLRPHWWLRFFTPLLFMTASDKNIFCA